LAPEFVEPDSNSIRPLAASFEMNEAANPGSLAEDEDVGREQR